MITFLIVIKIFWNRVESYFDWSCIVIKTVYIDLDFNVAGIFRDCFAVKKTRLICMNRNYPDEAKIAATESNTFKTINECFKVRGIRFNNIIINQVHVKISI